MFLEQKAYAKFITELTQEGAADANRPDTRGRMPMIEAVRTKELRYVDALIQSSVYARTKDAATGASPLHLAFQQNLIEVCPFGMSSLDPSRVCLKQVCHHTNLL